MLADAAAVEVALDPIRASIVDAPGEMVVFDRSWYNRAGVERVLGHCSDAESCDFMRSVPEFEPMIVRSGIQVVKYWFSVSSEVQTKRFKDRLSDPAKLWKFSDIDARSQARWNEYSRAKDIMVEHASIARPAGGRSAATTSSALDST